MILTASTLLPPIGSTVETVGNERPASATPLLDHTAKVYGHVDHRRLNRGDLFLCPSNKSGRPPIELDYEHLVVCELDDPVAQVYFDHAHPDAVALVTKPEKIPLDLSHCHGRKVGDELTGLDGRRYRVSAQRRTRDGDVFENRLCRGDAMRSAASPGNETREPRNILEVIEEPPDLSACHGRKVGDEFDAFQPGNRDPKRYRVVAQRPPVCGDLIETRLVKGLRFRTALNLQVPDQPRNILEPVKPAAPLPETERLEKDAAYAKIRHTDAARATARLQATTRKHRDALEAAQSKLEAAKAKDPYYAD